LQGAALRKPAKLSKSRTAYAAIPKPAAKMAKAEKNEKPNEPLRAKQMSALKRKGVTIDFVAVVGGTISTAATFAGDTTYYVSGAAIYTGPVTIEGGAVIKFKHQSVTPIGYASIKVNNTLTCKTSSYRPAIFTAADDNSVGAQVSNSGIQSGGYANPALWVYNVSSQQISNCRFTECQEAVRFEGNVGSSSIRHVQLVNCIRGVVVTGGGCGAATPAIVNSLFAKVAAPLTVSRGSTIVAFYNSTVDTPSNSARNLEHLRKCLLL